MINSRKICLFCLLALGVLNISAQIESGNPENWCRNGHFPQEADFKLATVTGASRSRVYFLNDSDACPREGDAKCIAKSYLVPGDKLIVTRKYGKWMCGWYQPPKGRETIGWLPAENLLISQTKVVPETNQWLGIWKFYGNSLETKKAARDGFLKVEGVAFWRGIGDNIHTGEVSGEGQPAENSLVLEEDLCRVRLMLVGDFLIAGDNLKCGGLNVSFNGVYRKMPK